MKTILAITIILLFAVGVHAQTGMPQSLSCTETAFNFSFSLDTKWKFSMPKMGPVNIRKMDNEVPAWAFKIKAAKLDTTKLPTLTLKNYTQKFTLPIKP
jgi:hypothetical protein